MQPYQVDEASGSRLIGGDMLAWSDLNRLTASSAVGFLVARLARRTGAGRVLLAGPRAAALLDAVPPELDVDLLVRGLPDARTLSSHARERTALHVYCGGLDRFQPGQAYDLVVALDGPEVLLTPDSPGMSHAATARYLTERVAPGGAVILSFANELGLDSVFRLELHSVYDDDSQWFRGAPGFDSRRLFARELNGVLDGAGIEVERRYCVFPSSERLSLLVADEATADPTVSSGIEASIARIEGEHFCTTPSLVDPYALARRVLDAGLSADLAPVWLVVGRVGRAQDAAQPPTELPAVLSGEDGDTPGWTAVMTLDHRDGGWERQVRSAGGRSEMSERRVARDLSAIGDQLAVGELLESALRSACAGGNLARIRELVQTYAAWLGSADQWDATTSRRRFFAVPSNVVLSSNGTPSLFDPSWSWLEELSTELLLLRGLRDFARRMLRSGAEHPWQPDISPDQLTQTLSAMADVTWTPQLSAEIAAREAELEVVVHGGDAIRESAVLSTNIDSGASQFTATPGPSRGYRETLAATGRMSQALHERADQVTWLEATLRHRDKRVGSLEHQLAKVQRSAGYRATRRMTLPARKTGKAVVAAGKQTAVDMLPPNFAERAERALRRVTNS